MSGLRRAGAALTLIVFLLSGCGGDDQDPDAGTDSAATEDGSAVPTTGPTADSPTGADGFCAEIEAAYEAVSDLDENPDLADPRAELDRVSESLDALRSVDPPGEIAEDWATVVSYLDDLERGLEGLDASTPDELIQQLEDLGDQLEADSAELEAAGTRIESHVRDECGVVLD